MNITSSVLNTLDNFGLKAFDPNDGGLESSSISK